MSKKKSVLFVCLGNICRSPLAEGIFKHLLEDQGLLDSYTVDSCGTGSWHVGNPPHQGSIDIASQHGIDISNQRSRQLRVSDFDEFSLIVAMDGENMKVLADNLGKSPARLVLLRDYDELGRGEGVPDPYYTDGFDGVYDIIERSCRSLLADLE